MSYRTVILSSVEEYLAGKDFTAEARAERNGWLLRFPHSVMLQVSFAELDFANRWCWQRFGPSNGECLEYQPDYRVCELKERHSHRGKWRWHFYEKTICNFGFCQWFFAERADYESFRTNVDEINWGKKYPKE